MRPVEADVFRFLETATPRSFDLVVIDPPKFARARKDLDAARKGYERLNALALQRLRAGRHPGHLLLLAERERRPTSSASSPPAPSRPGAACASWSGRGPGADHPLPPGFEEGQYLKVLFVHVGLSDSGRGRDVGGGGVLGDDVVDQHRQDHQQRDPLEGEAAEQQAPAAEEAAPRAVADLGLDPGQEAVGGLLPQAAQLAQRAAEACELGPAGRAGGQVLLQRAPAGLGQVALE